MEFGLPCRHWLYHSSYVTVLPISPPKDLYIRDTDGFLSLPHLYPRAITPPMVSTEGPHGMIHTPTDDLRKKDRPKTRPVFKGGVKLKKDGRKDDIRVGSSGPIHIYVPLHSKPGPLTRRLE